ncbi:site-specific integrase [Candidatus Chlorohelix sp.]|uniref:tyrosine-type recombinase/integrase n=1 Tax=Candidatus Chlorohelix sp. TaxID=3139201 RepID=UPI003074EE4B
MPRPPANVRSKKSKDRIGELDVAAPIAGQEGTSHSEIQADNAIASKVASLIDDTTAQPPRRRGGSRTANAQENQPVRAIQPPLFTVSSRGEVIQPASAIPPLTPDATLSVARWWFRSYLEQMGRPHNTTASYMYDLSGFDEQVGSDKRLDQITRDDINEFLTNSHKKSTRKRRLTSLGAFFKYLINSEKILDKDPTDNFYAEFIPLKTPVVLTLAEQAMLLDSAGNENSRTYLMVYFLVKLGFTRTELLAIQFEHVDISDRENPIVYVFYEDKRWHKKERKLAAAPEFTAAFQRYIAEFAPSRKLFEMLPQSVNKLVERSAKAAKINKRVTPQSLRDTFAVEEARQGANSTKLLLILGLAPDPRNRMSVERYIKLATPIIG